MSNQEKSERLDKLLSNLGYGARKDVRHWIKAGWISVQGEAAISPAQKVNPADVLLEGKPLDHPAGLTIIYHKPLETVCSRKEGGRLIYDDFPERWLDRKPPFSPVGRLDKETTGLLVVTDDGLLNHNLTSPKQHIAKTYAVTLAEPLQGHEPEIFAAGKLMLENDDRPCLPAELIIHSPQSASLTLHEGRYHQVRRMFATLGNHVVNLQRSHIGALALIDTSLKPGDYRVVGQSKLMQMVLGRPSG
ncbi:MAG: pseudouridine synthase [Mariprofundus sp.]